LCWPSWRAWSGWVSCSPCRRRDAAEYALLIALMTITSPLARAYYFVWLLFPFTLLVNRAAADPEPEVRKVTGWALAASIALFTAGVAIASPHILPALGNMFWATAILIGALAWLMRRSMAPKVLAEA
jgi:alpha-1,2-mannosyltransferase